MKKLANVLSVLALLASMTFGFNSCIMQNPPTQPGAGTTDQPTNPDITTDEPSLVGEWKCLYVEYEGEMETGGVLSYTFMENGSCIIVNGSYIGKGTYTLYEKRLIIEITYDGGTDTQNWTIKDLTKDMLVLSYGDADYVFKRVSVTDQPTNPDTTTDEPSLVGEWKCLYVEYEGEMETGGVLSYTFMENGSCIIVNGSYIGKGTYTLYEKRLIIEITYDGGTDTQNWTIKDLTKDMLVLSYGDADYVFKRV